MMMVDTKNVRHCFPDLHTAKPLLFIRYDYNDMRDSRTFSELCGVDASKQVPDGNTIGRF